LQRDVVNQCNSNRDGLNARILQVWLRIRWEPRKNFDKFSDRPGPVEQPNLVVFKLPTTTKNCESLMNCNRSPIDYNEYVKLPDLQMIGSGAMELTNSPNSFYSSKREPNEHVKLPNLLIVGTTAIELPNLLKLATYRSITKFASDTIPPNNPSACQALKNFTPIVAHETWCTRV